MKRLSEGAVIARVTSDEQILATCEVMLQLAVRLEDYLEAVRRMMRADGCRLAAFFKGVL